MNPWQVSSLIHKGCPNKRMCLKNAQIGRLSGIANWSTLSDCLAMFCKGVGTECLEESMHSPSFTSSDSCKKLETMSVQRIVKAMQSRNCIVQSLMPKNTFLVIFHGKINSSASFNFRIILSLRNFIELIPPSCQLRFCCLKRER